MSISFIKSQILLPEREIIINKSLVLRHKAAIVASITEQEGVVKLWIFQEMPNSVNNNIDEVDSIECVTNRDEIWRRISCIGVSCGYISEITIQGVSLPISQLSYSVIGCEPLAYMKLQHFIEAGIDFSSVENVGFNGLALGEYEMDEGFAFPKLDVKAGMPVSLTVREEWREVLVEPTHWFNLKVGEQNIVRSFYDPSSGKEIVYYIDKIFVQDAWKETEMSFRDEKTIKTLREQGLDDVAIEQNWTNIQKSLEGLCPRGNEWLIIQYECSDNIQLNFYTTEFLLSRPEKTESSTMVALYSSGEESRHGHQVRLCLLKTVPAGFEGTVEVELVSWYSNIPSEKVEA